jgi:hypothetical protein
MHDKKIGKTGQKEWIIVSGKIYGKDYEKLKLETWSET